MLRVPIVCVITRARGSKGSAERGLLMDRLVSAGRAGASMIQVRERLLDDRALVAFVRDLVAATSGTGCHVIVNDRPDVALAAGAGGVHLKSGSIAARDVRRIAPPEFVVGRSVHSEDEAAAAEEAGGCDYLVFGTIFPSSSKPDDQPVAGTNGLHRVCARVSLPIVAIGGITVPRAAAVRAAGAAGVAAISLFSESADIAAAVLALRNALTPQLGSV